MLPRSRVHTSIAASHYCEHAPFLRVEKQLERIGVDLPRVCQASLMNQLNRLSEPVVRALKEEIFGEGYPDTWTSPPAYKPAAFSVCPS